MSRLKIQSLEKNTAMHLEELRTSEKGRIILTPEYYGSLYSFLEGYSKVLGVEITEKSEEPEDPSSSSEEIPESYESESTVVSNFIKEAQSSAKLVHTNVVSV